MLTTPVFTRLLTHEEFGKIALFSSWQTIVSVILSLNILSCLNTIFVRYEDKKKVLSSLFVLELVIAAFWMIVYLCFSKIILSVFGMTRILCFCLFILPLSMTITDTWISYKKFLYQYRGFVGLTICSVILSSLISVFGVVFISPSADIRIASITLVSVIFAFFVVLIEASDKHHLWDISIWKFVLSFSIPLIPYVIFMYILHTSDRIMIAHMCPERDIAIYSIAYSIGSLISIFSASVYSSFIPYQFQSFKNKNYHELSKRTIQVLIFLGVILFCIMLFSHEVILIFGGKKYVESETCIVPICLGVYFMHMMQIFTFLQEYYLKKIHLLISSIICAVSNIILNYVFIQMFGYKAAAYTTFICYFLCCFLQYIFYKNIIRVKLNGISIYNDKQLFFLTIGIITLGIIAKLLSFVIWLKYCLLIFSIFIILLYRKSVIGFIKHIMQK